MDQMAKNCFAKKELVEFAITLLTKYIYTIKIAAVKSKVKIPNRNATIRTIKQNYIINGLYFIQ